MAQISTSPNSLYTHIMDAYDTGEVSGISRKVHYKYRVDVKTVYANGSWSGSDTRVFAIAVDGQYRENRTGFDTRNGADLIPLEGDVWVAVGGSAKTIDFSLGFQGWSSSFPAASVGGKLTLAAVANPPARMAAPVASAVTQTGMTLSWTLPANGGAAIDQILLRRYDSPAALAADWPYTNYVKGGGDTSHVVTGLTPGTSYIWVVYAHNVAGYSPQGLQLVQSTAAGNAPGLSVSPAPSGQGATVTLGPPSGMTGVTEYNIQRRLAGVVDSSTSATITKTYTGLTPGAIYEWRANAEVGAYTSPWTDWTPVAQPNPNTNPGDYFDGSTTAKADTTYAWLGTTNLSKSKAVGKGVKGWAATFTAPCEGTMSRVTGGNAGTYAARVAITRDADGPGQVVAGMKIAAVGASSAEAAGIYTGQIGVNPSKSQLMAAQITWLDGSYAPIGSPVTGTSVIVPANTWTQISVTLQSPAGTEYMVVRATDVAGTGHSDWLCGDWFLVDTVMPMLGGELIPWFSGDTVDTPGYQYDWIGTVNESESSRTTLIVEVTDPLADPDCPPLALPPLPPEIASECIEEVGSWNRYAVDIDKLEVPLFGVTIPSLIIHTAGSAERQVRIRFYPNPDDLPPNAVNMEAGFDAELILTYIPPQTDVTLDGVTQRVWAEVAGAEARTADHLLYGTGGVPATWPELRCGIGYVIALDTPLEAPAGNLSARVLLTQRV